MIFHGSLKSEAPIEQSMTMDMSNNDRTMLKSMLTDPNGEWAIDDLLESTGWNDQVHVAGSGQSLSELGLVAINESKIRTVSLDSEGEKALKMDYWRKEYGNGTLTPMRIRGTWKIYSMRAFKEMRQDLG